LESTGESREDNTVKLFLYATIMIFLLALITACGGGWTLQRRGRAFDHVHVAVGLGVLLLPNAYAYQHLTLGGDRVKRAQGW
jgi:hypothetical protein